MHFIFKILIRTSFCVHLNFVFHSLSKRGGEGRGRQGNGRGMVGMTEEWRLREVSRWEVKEEDVKNVSYE